MAAVNRVCGFHIARSCIMRWFIGARPRGLLISVTVVLLLTSIYTLSTGAISALATGAVNADGCPTGRVGVNIQWAESLITYACSVDPVADRTPTEVLGLVVRWSDGSVSTVD